ncbi:PREDICTED: tripartite motif-containing protein 35 [Elephantulus edwardii]|uniref:tripartite motif-containing protein 35 n=1 Tax=Elephantulus edwardii TaxID=28737 RepID=UPI0003F0BCC8|nr:PREDICTED: tripartite motif-containing protein 35 [Elephantulus edwardii]
MDQSPAASPRVSRAFREELLCAVCYDPFRDAVTLQCGHNFCRMCVIRCWEVQLVPTCPVCKDQTCATDLRTNHTLNNLVEKLQREEAEGARCTRHRSPRYCRQHRAPFSFFCLEDKELLCCSCHTDPRHQEHRVLPVKDTADDFRVESVWLEGQIRQEFDKVRDFLMLEEQTILDVLNEEVRQKQHLAEEKMKELENETKGLAREIERLQKEMKEDDVSFLRKHKSRKRRLFCTMEPDPMQPGMVLNVCKYLDSLQYRIWKKMATTFDCVPFIFDPSTAAGWLSLSEDLTTVTNCGYRVQVENPERFTLAPCVLGSATFSQGSHAWEVDLGELQAWRVGVVRVHPDGRPQELIDSCYHDINSGFWYVCRVEGPEMDLCMTSDFSLPPLILDIPRRLRVELECEEGELSFYDAERQCHLYTFHARFGLVRPYFYLEGVQAGEPASLRICPLRITVREELDG